MAKIGILGCKSTTEDMDCVMIGCFGAMRGRDASFADYDPDESLDLTGVISCGGCPTAVASDRVWHKVQALVDYGIDSLHLTSCLIQLCPFKDKFVETIRADFPDLKIVEGTHVFHDPEAFKKGINEVVSQRAVRPQKMNDIVFKRIKIASDKDD